jgi:hypothetical protein
MWGWKLTINLSCKPWTGWSLWMRDPQTHPDEVKSSALVARPSNPIPAAENGPSTPGFEGVDPIDLAWLYDMSAHQRLCPWVLSRCAFVLFLGSSTKQAVKGLL